MILFGEIFEIVEIVKKPIMFYNSNTAMKNRSIPVSAYEYMVEPSFR